MCGFFGPGRVGGWSVPAIVALLATVPVTAGQIHLASRADPPQAAPAGQIQYGSVASADGRYVAFSSDSVRQVPGQSDGNGWYDVFLHDRLTGDTVLVSRSAFSPTRTGAAGGTSPSISADGRYVAFFSASNDLIPGQVDVTGPTPTLDVFLFDRVTGTTTLVSRAHGTAAKGSNGNSFTPVISADGHYVAFTSTGTDLVAGQTDAGTEAADVFLYERTTGTVTLVSHAAGSPAAAGNGSCDINSLPALSADGRYAVYRCSSTNLVAGQTDANEARWTPTSPSTSSSMTVSRGRSPW